MTLNKVNEKIKIFSNNHPQLNTVRFGEMPMSQNTDKIFYPCLFYDLTPSKISVKEKGIYFGFEFSFADLRNLEKTNEVEVISDLTSISADFAAWFYSYINQNYWEVESLSDLQYFLEGNKDNAIIAKITVVIKVDFTANACEVQNFDEVVVLTKIFDNSFDQTFE